jgi:hypothetical protein
MKLIAAQLFYFLIPVLLAGNAKHCTLGQLNYNTIGTHLITKKSTQVLRAFCNLF